MGSGDKWSSFPDLFIWSIDLFDLLINLNLIYLPKFINPFQAVSFLYPLKTLKKFLCFWRFQEV